MILFKNTKAMIRSPDDDTEFFDSVTGSLQSGILVLYVLTRIHPSIMTVEFYIEKYFL